MSRLWITSGVLLLAAALVGGCKPSPPPSSATPAPNAGDPPTENGPASSEAALKAIKGLLTEAQMAALSKPLVEWPGKGPAEVPEGAKEGLRVYVKGKLVRTIPLSQDIRERALEAWVTVSNLDQRGTSVLTIEGGRESWDGILYGELEPRKWYPGSSFRHRSKQLAGRTETAGPNELVHLVAVYNIGGRIALYRNGQVYGDAFVPTGPAAELQAYPADASNLRINAEGKFAFQGDVKEARLYNRAFIALEVTALYLLGKQRLSAAK